MATVRHLGLFPLDAGGLCVSEYSETAIQQLVFFQMDSLREAMDAIWRVKRWKFSSNEGEVASSYSFSLPDSATEKDLVCQPVLHSAFLTFGDPSSTWFWSAGLIETVEGAAAVRRRGNEFFYAMAMQVDGEIFGENEFLTKEKTGYLTFQFAAPYGSVTVTPEEYWPYDPQDGLGPIYNTATGAQLRPFSD